MTTTPLMKQYLAMKEEYADAILLYRMGDFYELFNEDAVTASRVLGLTLTSRNSNDANPIPLAGFPYHSIDKHMPRLINAGYKVAICEQVEDPALAQGIVKREVVEVITRGTTINDNCLEAKNNNYLAAVFPEGEVFGFSYLDLSTGLFIVMQGNERQVSEEVYRLNAREMLYPEGHSLSAGLEDYCGQGKILITLLDKAMYNAREAKHTLTSHFGVHSLDSFGCRDDGPEIQAAGAVLAYVKNHKKTELNHIIKIIPRNFNDYMNLDAASIRNLEIIEPIHSDDDTGTLVHLLDKTVTAMGGRKLKFWLTHPLLQIDKINKRQNSIKELIDNGSILQSLRRSLREINDIERIVAKVGSKRANARDLQGLGSSLASAAAVGGQLGQLTSPMFTKAAEILCALGDLGHSLTAKFVENPPLTLREGNMLRPENHPELLQISKDVKEGKQWLNNLETSMKEEAGIPSLKVGFNKVFGYYIEVTKAHSSKVPASFIRKQTLVNGERYITPEMKEWESKILNAEGQANDLEYKLFCQIRDEISLKAPQLLEAAQVLGSVDVLCSLAKISRERGYCLPSLDEGSQIKIIQGRHPVVEALCQEGDFIPNDAFLDLEKRQILLITGPNMAGKSTYLRQLGIICLMAQVGSFVPATEAHIGLVDRIFTRVGASDRLSRGQSTFMVEMIETASILHNATPRSLILLDEIGRGTSTFDGLSLAWAIVEALHQNPEIAAKTLFATHYHELTILPEKLPRAVNVHISVRESAGKVIFLRKILEGSCDSSYGIQVASMAGIPEPITQRAWEILANLEKDRSRPSMKSLPPAMTFPRQSGFQQDMFIQTEKTDPNYKKLYDEVLNINLNNMTPLEALNKLAGIQKKYT
jgi:DNA mismatch repair protein MutS